jgi:hypothetical protein
MKDVYTEIHPGRIDLLVKRDTPMRDWPSGELKEWARFSFPLRCREAVEELAKQCEWLGKPDRISLVNNRRRKILWP